jgi:hypothetical protein
MKLATIGNVVYALRRAIKREKPFSIMRLGDGEYEIVRGMCQRNANLLTNRISRWVNTAQITTEEIYDIGESIVTSYETADIVGVPNEVEGTYPKWHGFTTILPRIVHRNSVLCDFHVVTHIDYRKLFTSGEIKSVGLVSCRAEPVKRRLNELGLRDVAIFDIAPETFSYSASFNDSLRGSKPHYPDRFQEFPSWAKFVLRRPRIIFIGAGGFGKIYCAIVKKYGGIAVDVGSLFDGWCGCPTRPYLKRNPRRFVL